MAFMLPDYEINQGLHEVSGDLIKSSWSESFAAVAEDYLVNGPLGDIISLGGKLQIDYPNPMEVGYELERFRPPLPKQLSSEDYAQSPWARKGLSFPNGVNEDVARFMAEQYDERIKREDIIAKHPGNWLTFGAPAFAVGLAASMLDPINVASAFIPIVGQARYAGMLSRLGKFGARATKGAIEGAVGQAMLEPLHAIRMSEEQRDYHFTDVLTNIAFGAALGGGLHMIAGGIGDYVERYSIQTKEQALRTAVAQIMDGRAVDVEPLLKVASALEHNEPLSVGITKQETGGYQGPERRVNAEHRKRISEMTQSEMEAELLTNQVTGIPNRRAFEEADLHPMRASIDVDSLKWINDNMGHETGDKMLREIAGALHKHTDDSFGVFHVSGDEFIAHGLNEKTLRAKLDAARQKLKGITIKATMPDGTVITKEGLGFSYGIGREISEAEAGLQADKFRRETHGERAGRGARPGGVAEFPAGRNESAGIEGREGNLARAEDLPTREDFEATHAPDRETTTDFGYAKIAEEQVKESPVEYTSEHAQALHDEAMAYIDDLRQREILTEADLEQLSRAQEELKWADTLDKMSQAAAACLARTGE